MRISVLRQETATGTRLGLYSMVWKRIMELLSRTRHLHVRSLYRGGLVPRQS